jgi:hypothetical protein
MHETTCGRQSRSAPIASQKTGGACEAPQTSPTTAGHRTGSAVRPPASSTGQPAAVHGPARWRTRWLQFVSALRSAANNHGALRYAQVLPVAVVLWGTDAVDRFRAGAAAIGFKNAVVVADLGRDLGGAVAQPMNAWLVTHPIAGSAAAWYYIVLNGALTGVVGLLLIWRRAPTFGLHRNALIACNLIALVAFWLYPVAPPRMLPGYHDIAATAVPVFSKMFESKAADQFASLPSLHVAWALWVAVAATALVRKPLLRALVWLYPAFTIADVLATANHFILDVITAPGLLLLAYLIALSPALARRAGLRIVPPWPRRQAELAPDSPPDVR